jgi:hypothetical protein
LALKNQGNLRLVTSSPTKKEIFNGLLRVVGWLIRLHQIPAVVALPPSSRIAGFRRDKLVDRSSRAGLAGHKLVLPMTNPVSLFSFRTGAFCRISRPTTMNVLPACVKITRFARIPRILAGVRHTNPLQILYQRLTQAWRGRC